MSDVTIKVSEEKFAQLLDKLLISTMPHLPFKGSSPGADEFGILVSEETTESKKTKTYLHVSLPWFGVEGEFHVVASKGIEFNDSNTFTINELDIAWDKFIFKAGVDVPTLTFGGFCLKVPHSIFGFGGGCTVSVPPVTLFSKSPDIELPLDLSPLFKFIVTEISAICSIEMRLDTDTGEEVWAVHADPVAVDFDLVDIQDTLGSAPAIVSAAMAAAVLKLQAMFPMTWVADLFLGWLGLPTMSRLVADVFDLHDDIEEWLMKRLEFSIGIDNLLSEVLFDAILDSEALVKVPRRQRLAGEVTDTEANWGGYAPHGVTPAPGSQVTLPDVRLPIAKPDVSFTDVEMTLAFDFEV